MVRHADKTAFKRGLFKLMTGDFTNKKHKGKRKVIQFKVKSYAVDFIIIHISGENL